MPASTLKLAREILSRSRRADDGTLLPSLFAGLARSLQETAGEHTRASTMPRVPAMDAHGDGDDDDDRDVMRRRAFDVMLLRLRCRSELQQRPTRTG